jgi:RND family efflux transporter MFP subunit
MRRNLAIPAAVVASAALFLTSCDKAPNASANTAGSTSSEVTVGVTKVARRSLGRKLTLSSELVPFQEIDVYAKEAGYVRKLNVDYGSRVKEGDVLAVLEIPELESQLQQDDAAIKNASDQIGRAQHELARAQAQGKVLHLQYDRLNAVAKSKPGLVAQQEVDDAEGKDLAGQAQTESDQAALEAAQSQLALSQAKRQHDQVLFDYSKITAPFSGVVTQRYANLGTLVQAGTNSSTQALPLVKLSEDDKFRLVIPVPESYVRYTRIGDPVSVNVPSLNRTFPGKVTRFSVDVREDTRTMHTEVDVENPGHVLIPGLYAEATLTLDERGNALSVPLQAVDHSGDQTNVFVVTPAHKIEVRRVTLGVETASQAEVLAGLQEGEDVVVSDRSGLKSGEDVRPQAVQLVEYQPSDDK